MSHPSGRLTDVGGLDLRILAAVTRRGRRLLTYAELEEEGASEEEILGRVTRGSLQRVHAGVYLVGAGELTWQEQVLAGVLAAGDTAKASRFSAWRLWGLGNVAPVPIHVDIVHETHARAAGVVVHRTRQVTPVHIVQGVPCVSVEQALLGCAPRLPARMIHQALTSAWRRRLTTPAKVLAYLDTYAGRGVAGTRKLREIATLYVDTQRGPGSEAEADFVWELFDELDRCGIERPELQYPIDVRDRAEKVVPDFVWPFRIKVVEMLGLEAHGNYAVQDADVERAAAIRAAGWELEEVTPRAVRERPTQTIARIVRFLQTPAPHRSGSISPSQGRGKRPRTGMDEEGSSP